MIAPEELAENANTYTPLGPGEERIVNERYVLYLGRGEGPGWNVAQRFRLRVEEIAEVRAEIHDALRARGRTACSWEVGTSATPGDLVERLVALGLVDDEPTPLAVGMILTEAPSSRPPPDVEVRLAMSDDERLASAQIATVAFGDGPAPTEVPPARPNPDNLEYLAYVDGEPVARASGSYSASAATLFGGATLPEARGRGAYRALVQARWDEAVRRGTPVLVTQASPMSRPILEQLGFRVVCEIRILVDDFGGRAPSG